MSIPPTLTTLPDWHITQLQSIYDQRVQAAFAVDYDHIPNGERHPRRANKSIVLPGLNIRYKHITEPAWREMEVAADTTLRRLKAKLGVGRGQTLTVRIETPFGVHVDEIPEVLWEWKVREVMGWVSGFLIKDCVWNGEVV
jgi:hypothetical protein